MNSESRQYLLLTDQLLQTGFEQIGELGAADIIEQLREAIEFHDRLYYVDTQPVITDLQYDILFKGLKILEQRFPHLISSDSPTQRVAQGLNPEFATVKHLTPMLSLDNTYNEADLLEFDRKVRDGVPAGTLVTYCVEPKFDGSSIALVYENDQFVRAATRGNGIEGDEITVNARTIRRLPLKANFSTLGIHRIELRGEVVIELGAFQQLNEARKTTNERLRAQGKKELELFKHARNTAAGALRMKDPKEVSARNLEVFIYNVGYAEDKAGRDITSQVFPSHFEALETLIKLGFPSSTTEKQRFTDIREVIAWCEAWEVKRDSYPYEMDGMVIKVDDIRTQVALGKTSHHPKWAVAFKFKARQARSVLRRIEYQVGRTGAITPVAKIDPILLTGVEISSISLHNEEFIREKDIRIGDTVIVERAGDVIPYIVGSVPEVRSGQEVSVIFPEVCPSCSHHLVKPEAESIWRCINPSCPAQLEERLIHFASRDAMDIGGLGQEIVIRFIREGILSDMAGIYRLPFDRIRALEGWKDRSVQNLRENIEKSKHHPMWRLIVALGIRHVGTATAKMLAKQVERLTDFREWQEEELATLPDVGPKVAESIRHFFQDEDNIRLIEELAALGVNILKEEEVLASNALAGKTFLFTGTLTRMSRDDARALVEAHGGKNLSGVSENLHYLVAGEKAGSKLTKAQKMPSIQIIDEEAFLEMLGK
jgi:DNA ligase (NAD+)